jgi:hypothetical protein
MLPVFFAFYSTLSPRKSDFHHHNSAESQSYQGQQWLG